MVTVVRGLEKPLSTASEAAPPELPPPQPRRLDWRAGFYLNLRLSPPKPSQPIPSSRSQALSDSDQSRLVFLEAPGRALFEFTTQRGEAGLGRFFKRHQLGGFEERLTALLANDKRWFGSAALRYPELS